MSEKFYTLLTNVGKASIINATLKGTKVNFRKLVLGDGNGSYYEPSETQTQLRRKVWEGEISSVQRDTKNTNWLIVETLVSGETGGFTIREAGILDDRGQLMVIAKYPETYKPNSDDGTMKHLTVRLILEVSNASAVTLKIDPSIVIATKQDIIDMGKTKAPLAHNHDDRYHTKQQISTLLDSKVNKEPIEFSGTMSNLLVFHGAGNVQTHTIGWKIGKNCYFNFEVSTIRNKIWNHNDTIFTIPVGFRPKYPTLVIFFPRRKIQLDCRFILNPDGRCWLHSSETDGRKFTEGDYYTFSSFYISEI